MKLIVVSLLKADQNPITFPMTAEFFVFEEKCSMTTWSRGPRPLEKRCHVISNVLDHAESQSGKKYRLGKMLDGQTICSV